MNVKKIVLILCVFCCYSCSKHIFSTGRYTSLLSPITEKKPTISHVYSYDFKPDNTYEYRYKSDGFYQEYSLGSWFISPSGNLTLRDSLLKVTEIPIKVHESSIIDSNYVVFEFNPGLEPGFWHLVVDSVMYVINDKQIKIPGKNNFEYFYLLGFNIKYEGLNSPNTIVRTEIYHVKERTKNLFNVDIPQYASDYNILFYKPLNESFIIKNKKVIQDNNKFEYFLEIPK